MSERQALFVGSGRSDGWHAALLPLPQFLHPLLVAVPVPTSPSHTDTNDVTAAHEKELGFNAQSTMVVMSKRYFKTVLSLERKEHFFPNWQQVTCAT